MYRFLYTGVLVVLLLLTLGLSAQSYDVTIVGSSLIKLHGSSNVNKFMLSYTKSISGKRQITIGKVENNRRMITGSNKISLEVGAFTSAHKMITSDFKKMLQQEKYPQINIELSRMIVNPANPSTPSIMAVLTIAGTRRLEILPVVIVSKPNNVMQLSSLHKISLKNYNLTPPKRVMGMVNVSDEVFIEMTVLAQYKQL